jgi:hypothetical protein
LCSKAVQADLVNLLDLNLLQANDDDEDDGVEMDKSANVELNSEDQQSREDQCEEKTSLTSW